jgi:putative chitinase
MNSDKFWSTLRADVFGGKMTQGVVDTINSIVDTYYSECFAQGDPEHLAYILATAYHESYHPTKNPEWLPVREGFTKTNQGAINAVTKLYDKGIISVNYALPKENGLSYYGRGFAQITHDYNYKKIGNRIGIDLYGNPDLALDRDTASKILVIGSVEGLYTGKRLSDYDLKDGLLDAVNARRVINGRDKAEKIDGDYQRIHKAILNAISA